MRWMALAACALVPTSVWIKTYALMHPPSLCRHHRTARAREDWSDGLHYGRYIRSEGQGMAGTKRTQRRRPKPAPPVEDPNGLGPDAGRSGITLGHLLDTVGSSVAQVVAAPAGVDVRVGDPIIYDALERS